MRRGPLLAGSTCTLLGMAILLLALLAPAAGAALDTWSGGQHVHLLPTPPRSLLGSGVSELETLHPGHKKIGFLKQREGTDPPLLYKPKGTVQSEPKVYLILWGENWSKEPGAAMNLQLKAMFEVFPKSVYQEILTQYFDETKNISANLTLKTYVDNSVKAPTAVNKEKVVKEAESAINTNKWAREADAQFVVIPSPEATYEAGFNLIEKLVFCAYHTFDASNSSISFDPYVGDEPFKKECQAYDKENNVKNVTTMLASHEYAESATDPLLNA